jgi:hypothetical protein
MKPLALPLSAFIAFAVGVGACSSGSRTGDDLPTGVPPVRQTEAALRSPTPTPVPKAEACAFDAAVCDTARGIAKAMPVPASHGVILALASAVTATCTADIIASGIGTPCTGKTVGTTVEGFLFWKTEKTLLERDRFAEWLDSTLAAYSPGADTRPLLLACPGDPGKQDCARYFAIGVLPPWDDGDLLILFFHRDGGSAGLIGAGMSWGSAPAASGGWHDTSHWAVDLPEQMYFQPVAAEAFK